MARNDSLAHWPRPPQPGDAVQLFAGLARDGARGAVLHEVVQDGRRYQVQWEDGLTSLHLPEDLVPLHVPMERPTPRPDTGLAPLPLGLQAVPMDTLVLAWHAIRSLLDLPLTPEGALLIPPDVVGNLRAIAERLPPPASGTPVGPVASTVPEMKEETP